MFWLDKIASDYVWMGGSDSEGSYPYLPRNVARPDNQESFLTDAKTAAKHNSAFKTNVLGPIAKTVNQTVRGWTQFSRRVLNGGSNIFVAPVQATMDKLKGDNKSWSELWADNTLNNQDKIYNYYADTYTKPTMLDELQQWAGEPHPVVDTLANFAIPSNWTRNPAELATTLAFMGATKPVSNVFTKVVKTPISRWANNKLLDMGYKDLASSVSKGRLRAAVPAR